MWFGKRTSRNPRLTRDQAYDARPVAVHTLDRSPLRNEGQRLVIPLRPRGYQKWLLRIPDDATRTIDLDSVGVEVFGMCDGKTTVRQITKRFVIRHRVDPHEAEIAVTTFIRMLMRKGLVYITVDKR